MLWQYEANKDPNKTVHLLKAIQWTQVAWEAVSLVSIQKCWWKSTIIKKPDNQAEDIASQEQQDQDQDRDELQAQIAQLPNIADLLSVNEFIQLGSEEIEDDNEGADEYEIFQQVVERYRLAEEDTIKPADDAVNKEEEVDIPISKAIKALETLKLFEMRQEDGSEVLLRALDQADRRYLSKKHEGKKQQTIDSFFQKR